MNALSIIISIVLILVSLVLIVAVLMQQGQRQGLGAISGGAETFLGKNAASTVEGKLKTLTKIAAVVFIVLALVATMITAHVNNVEMDAQQAELEAALESGEAHVHEDGTVHYGEHEEDSTDETAETPAQDATEAPADETAETPTEEPTAQPTAEPAAEASAEPTEKPAA